MRNSKEHTNRRGFSIIELIVVLGMTMIIAIIGVLNLGPWRNRVEISSTAKQIASLLREASGRAANQEQNKQWGVHFEDASDGGFFALFSGTSYDAANVVSRYPLPRTIKFGAFDGAAVPVNGTKDIVFDKISGTPAALTSASAKVTIQSSKDQEVTSDIEIFNIGRIKYQIVRCVIICSPVVVTLPPPPVVTILRPDGDFTVQWTKLWQSKNYLEVNETVPDGNAGYVKASIAGKVDRYNFGTFTIPQGAVVTKVKFHFFGKITIDTGALVAIGTRIGGTIYATNVTFSPSTYVERTNEFTTNPATGAAWTQSDIDVLTSYVKLNNITGGGDARVTQVYAEVTTQAP